MPNWLIARVATLSYSRISVTLIPTRTSSLYSKRGRTLAHQCLSTNMDKQTSSPRDGASVMATRARQLFQTLAMLNALDLAELHATPEQFAAAARITARTLSIARGHPR